MNETTKATTRPLSRLPRPRRRRSVAALAGALLILLLAPALHAQAPAPSSTPQASQAPAPKPDFSPPEDVAAPPPDAEKTASGLASKVLREGTGDRHPDANDMVAAHFIGWTPDGTKFRSSYDQNDDPVVFYLDRVFPGWQEGVQLMVVGEKRRLWIPGELAPQNPKSGPTGPVVFDLELVGLRPVPNPPESLVEPPEEAEPTGSGSYTLVLEEGQGTEKPAADSVVLAHFTGWGADGRTFDSTVYRGRPTAFPLDKVLAPFADAVRQMVVGEKRLIWLPGNIAAGQWPSAPPGPLVFEVLVLRIMPGDVIQEGTPEGQPGVQRQGSGPIGG